MATAFLIPTLILFTIVIALGWLYETRQRANMTADAMAIGWANQMVMWPIQQWSSPKFNYFAVPVYNGASTRSFLMTGPPEFPLLPGSEVPDRWLPAYVRVRMLLRPPATGLDSLLTTIVRVPLAPALDAVGMARVNQVQLGSFYQIRERVVFMFDYSRSMRLPYTGQLGGDTGLSGLEVMRSTARSVLSNYANYSDFTVMPFSTQEGTNTPAPMINGRGNVAQQQYTTQLENALREVDTTGTSGSGTDIDQAVRLGLTAFVNNDTTQFFSTKRLVIVTDGEPTVAPGLESDGISYEQKVAQASQNARQAINYAWGQGVMTSVAYMEREQGKQTSSSVATSAQDFLRSISGTRDAEAGAIRANPNNFYSDAGDAGGIARWLNQQPVFTVCESQLPIQLLNYPYQVPTYLLPTSGEPYDAYFTLGNGGPSDPEVPIANIFYDRQQFLYWVQAYGGVVVQNSYVDLQMLNDPSRHAVLFDQDGRVLLSPALCIAITGPMNQSNRMRVRMRWGAPRTVEPLTWSTVTQ